MTTEDPRITIGFYFIDHFGNKFSACSTLETFEDIGRDDLAVIGEQLNAFLKQMTYSRTRDYMLMEDLTEDELWYLTDCLNDLRATKDTGGESEEISYD